MCADRPVAALSQLFRDSLFWAVKAPWADPDAAKIVASVTCLQVKAGDAARQVMKLCLGSTDRGRLSLSHVCMRAVGDAFAMNHLGRKIVSQRECTQRRAT